MERAENEGREEWDCEHETSFGSCLSLGGN